MTSPGRACRWRRRWLNGSVVIDIDPRTEIRNPALGRLVEAVVGADEHDEHDWIEWKSTLDLSTNEGCFPIAKNILGLANRPPDSAAQAFEGLGYIVVGAEPGNLAGVVSVDMAELGQRIERWCGGAEGPRYSPQYVRVEDKTTLVVVVEAPKPGDPIHTLRKSFERFEDGEIFVRKPGRTERATSADVKALVERAAGRQDAPPELEVTLVGDIPLPWIDADSTDRVIADWVSSEQGSMLRAAHDVERARNPARPSPELDRPVNAGGPLGDIARQAQSLTRMTRAVKVPSVITSMGSAPDRRSLAAYTEEVNAWAERARRAAPAVVASRLFEKGHGVVAVAVRNPSGRFLHNVRVEVSFDNEGLRLADPDPVGKHLPEQPRPYGRPEPFLPRSTYRPPPILPSTLAAPSPRSWVEGESARIVFDAGDLRQEATEESSEHRLLLSGCPPDRLLRGTWKATVPYFEGVLRGTVEIPVREDPIDLNGLLELDPG